MTVHLTHLGLPVREASRSRQFYETYFRFDPSTAQEYHDGTVIIRNADGFDLALHPGQDVGALPPFLHFGFRFGDAAEVRDLLARMRADGVRILEDDDGASYVGFKCEDPDGHRVESYWEP